jgi:hypothetical protein
MAWLPIWYPMVWTWVGAQFRSDVVPQRWCYVLIELLQTWGDFCLYSLPNSISWESCQFAIHNWNSQWSQVSILYQSLVHMSSYIGTFFMRNQISACFIFTWPEKLYPFLCAIYLDLVSCLMEPTCTGPVMNCIRYFVRIHVVILNSDQQVEIRGFKTNTL